MSSLPIVPPDVHGRAVHGSFCPKLCNHACPVTEATGRHEAMPWSFHRVVADLGAGRLDPTDRQVADRLTHCTGCLGCQVPCTFTQDVPAEVRAGRAAVVEAWRATPDGRPALVARALEAADGTAGDVDVDVVGTGVVALVDCCARPELRDAAERLLASAGVEDLTVATVAGCAGARLRDLGAVPEADALQDRARRQLAGAARIVVLDVHALPELRQALPDVEIVHVVAEVHTHLAAGRLTFHGDLGAVTYHDPCLLARQEQLVQEPRTLLVAAGARLVEPEHHGRSTACSGAGLGYETLAPEDAEATTARRRAELHAAGGRVVTACAGARQRLAADGSDVADLLPLLADHLQTGTDS